MAIGIEADDRDRVGIRRTTGGLDVQIDGSWSEGLEQAPMITWLETFREVSGVSSLEMDDGRRDGGIIQTFPFR